MLAGTKEAPNLEPLAKKELSAIADVEVVNEGDGKKFASAFKEAHAVIVDVLARVSGDLIAEMSNCKIIVTVSVGFDHIDVEAATRKGIYVSNIPGYCVEEVADHTIGLLLAVIRKICFLNNITKAGKWERWLSAQPIPRLRGMKLGIIGLGRIGTAVAIRAKAFGLEVIAYDPYLPQGRPESLGVKPVDLDSLLRDSDIISIHAPLTKETYHMISLRELEKMKKDVFLINTARAQIVDPTALVEALKSGKVAGAGLDIFEKEPVDRDDPLLRMDQVVLTPHTAFLSVEAQQDRQRMAVEEIARVLRNEPPRSAVNYGSVHSQ